MGSSLKDNDEFSCCESTWFPTKSFTFLAEYKLDAEGFSLDKTSPPYKRHLHIVEGLVGEDKKIVQVSDIIRAEWMLGMWRNTRTRAEFLDTICVNSMLENYVTNDLGAILHGLPRSMTTRGVGKIWSQDSMYLTSKALETINKLNPTNKKSTELPVSVLRRSKLESGEVLSVYPVILPHPPSFLPVKDMQDNKQAASEITIVMGTVYKKNTAYTEWLHQGMVRRGEKKFLQMKDDKEEFWRCLCCCCARMKSEEK